ncbi:hypothetical protein, partial [Desulfoplanes sp.]
HLYQVLANELDVTHWKVSVGYGVAQLFIFSTIIGLSQVGLWAVWTGLFGFAICWFFIDAIIKRKAWKKSMPGLRE